MLVPRFFRNAPVPQEIKGSPRRIDYNESVACGEIPLVRFPRSRENNDAGLPCHPWETIRRGDKSKNHLIENEVGNAHAFGDRDDGGDIDVWKRPIERPTSGQNPRVPQSPSISGT